MLAGQKGWLLSPFLSLFITKHRESLGIGMENRQRDGFFGSLNVRLYLINIHFYLEHETASKFKLTDGDDLKC
jgi:hypothetical protein